MQTYVSLENHGGRPRGELSPVTKTSGHEAESQQESPADSSLTPLIREPQRGQERSHEQLVEAFRHAIRHEQQALGALAKYHSPVKIIDTVFRKQVQFIFSDKTEEKARGEFFAQIQHAWEVIAYEHYGKGSLKSGNIDRHYAGLDLSSYYQRAKALHTSHPELIRFSDPLQIQILDAAAEAADIPHHHGQAAFEIPEHLRDYDARLRKVNEEGTRRWR